MDSAIVPSEYRNLHVIKKRELAKLLRVNPWTIDRWRKLGRFPKPIMLTDQTLVWRLADVERWLNEREASQ